MKRTGREDRLRRQPQLAHGDPHPHRHQYRPQADQGRPFPLRDRDHPVTPRTRARSVAWTASKATTRQQYLCRSADMAAAAERERCVHLLRRWRPWAQARGRRWLPRRALHLRRASARGEWKPGGSSRPGWQPARLRARRVLAPRTRRVKLIGRRRENATAASPWT